MFNEFDNCATYTHAHTQAHKHSPIQTHSNRFNVSFEIFGFFFLVLASLILPKALTKRRGKKTSAKYILQIVVDLLEISFLSEFEEQSKAEEFFVF